MKNISMLYNSRLPCCFAGVFFVSASAAMGDEELPKTLADFEKSAVAGTQVPVGLPEPLRAMWHAKAGQWEQAHEIAQDIKTPTGSWIHAFLHREEGDLANAGYWYRRAGMTMPKGFRIAEEWSFIARELWQRENGITPGEETLTSTIGLVATSENSAVAEEGSWDSLIQMNGKQVIRIENARPVSFSPAGDVLLLSICRPSEKTACHKAGLTGNFFESKNAFISSSLASATLSASLGPPCSRSEK